MMGGPTMGGPMTGAPMMPPPVAGAPMPGGARVAPPFELSEEQQRRMAEVAREAHASAMNLVRTMYEESARLRELFARESPDPRAIGESYARIFDAQRQLIETNVSAFNRQVALLTAEQRELWQRMRRGMTPPAPR